MATMNWIARLSFILGLSFSACAHEQSKKDTSHPAADAARSQAQPADQELVQTFKSENREITLYPPQVESWSGDQLKERAVVAIQTPSSPQATYGLVWLTAKTQVDPKTHRVSFEETHVTKAQFPSAPELEKTSLKVLREHEKSLLKPVALESLQSNLAIQRAEAKVRPLSLKNGPPKIVVTRSPTLLVLIDGAPVLRDSGVSGLMRVINTRALILYDSSKDRYFLSVGNRWMDAHALQGPWIETDQPGANLEQAKQLAVNEKQVDLMNDPDSPFMRKVRQGNFPQIYVSTEPAEILETEGKPELQSIAGTHLLYVSNTDDTLFLDQKDQNYYVLLSGRWYSAKSLDGPWRYLPATRLPKDFAKIPVNHRKGAALASVPGTQQAGEAKISNEVPQTAKVSRADTTLDVKYDGDPKFDPVEDTKLKYAVNTKTPVIEVDPHSYYALQGGVWFEAGDPQGPWKVATRVPAVIYTIPTSSPIYYVTYVRIYDATPDSVYVGYTPGYLGSYCCSDGVVVYGTGYYYPPWIGTYWVGPPITFGVGFYYGAGYYPWWGPWWVGTPVYIGYPYEVTTGVPVGQGTVYQGWSSGVVQTQNPAPFQSAYAGSGGAWTVGSHVTTVSPPPPTSSWNVGESAAGTAAPGATAPGAAAHAAPAAPPFESAPPSSSNWGMGPSVGAGAPPPPPPPPPPAAAPLSQGFHGSGWGAGHK